MITRFAPSPTGPLHLGHAYSAILADTLAQKMDGTFLLRIEDIDQSRARAHWEDQIYADLAWLGLTWPTSVMRQSDRLDVYKQTLQKLWSTGFVFSCGCSRRDVLGAMSAPQEGASPPTGPDGFLYPGTCRPDVPFAHNTLYPKDAAMRLNMRRAVDGQDVFRFTETGHGPNGETGEITYTADEAIEGIGDIVLARRDMGTSYHLSVVVDDAAQGITHVVRGADLFEATKIHVILQTLLGLPTPMYHHHDLVRDDTGKRLAKRDDARAIAKFRDEGATPSDIRKMVGL